MVTRIGYGLLILAGWLGGCTGPVETGDSVGSEGNTSDQTPVDDPGERPEEETDGAPNGDSNTGPTEEPEGEQGLGVGGLGNFFSGNVHPDDCGQREVRNVPADVVLEETQVEVHSVDPPDSVLGQVVGALRFNETCDPLVGDHSTVYAVGANGEIEPADRPPFLDLFPQPQLRFVVRNGCLETESAEPDAENPFNNGGIEIIWPENLCDDGSFPIGQLGLGDFFTEFICAKLDLTPCVDCGEDDEGWFRRATATLRVEAHGSLDEVLLRNECGDIVGVGSIEEGDTAVVTISIETRFRVVDTR